jgi:hypothetical protein
MSGGGGQMPMASNAGQQQQQMGMQPQGMMGGQPQIAQQMQNPQMGMQPQGNAIGAYNALNQQQQMPPAGGMLGGQTAQQVPSGFQMDQAALQQMMQRVQQMESAGGGMQPAMGIAALGGQSPTVDKYGIPYDVPTPMPMQGGMGAPMDYGTPRMQSDMNPYQQNPNQVDMRPTNMQQQQSAPPLPGAGVPPGYRPTNGAIDGRHLRDMMDIYRSRPLGNMGGEDDRGMGRLPGAISNDLPPSLKRPTQGNYKNFK